MSVYVSLNYCYISKCSLAAKWSKRKLSVNFFCQLFLYSTQLVLLVVFVLLSNKYAHINNCLSRRYRQNVINKTNYERQLVQIS